MTSTTTSFGRPSDVSRLRDHFPYGLLSVEQLTQGIEAGCVDGVLLVTPDNSGRCLGERVPPPKFIKNLNNPTAYRMPLLLWGVDIEQVPRPSLDHVGGMGVGVPDVY